MKHPSRLMHPRLYYSCHNASKLHGVSCRTSSSSQEPTRVIVVGGGVGGLSAAGRLSRAGLSVTVLEKNIKVCVALKFCDVSQLFVRLAFHS